MLVIFAISRAWQLVLDLDQADLVEYLFNASIEYRCVSQGLVTAISLSFELSAKSF